MNLEWTKNPVAGVNDWRMWALLLSGLALPLWGAVLFIWWGYWAAKRGSIC